MSSASIGKESKDKLKTCTCAGAKNSELLPLYHVLCSYLFFLPFLSFLCFSSFPSLSPVLSLSSPLAVRYGHRILVDFKFQYSSELQGTHSFPFNASLPASGPSYHSLVPSSRPSFLLPCSPSLSSAPYRSARHVDASPSFASFLLPPFPLLSLICVLFGWLALLVHLAMNARNVRNTCRDIVVASNQGSLFDQPVHLFGTTAA